MNFDIKYYFNIAANVALPHDKLDLDSRLFWLAAVGIRSDNVMVTAKNLATKGSRVDDFKRTPCVHAEVRTLSKMDKTGTLFVVRIGKKEFLENEKIVFKNARPCEMCRVFIKSKKIKKVYYTMSKTIFGENLFGIWYPEKNYDEIFKM
jgi:tRNA(Arg) A34 adenosine deaminase TadA